MSTSTRNPAGPLTDRSNLLRAALAEAAGTFLLVLVGTGVVSAAALGRETAGAAYDSLSVALAFGLTLTALVAAIGQVSGAHVNPAVTIGLATAGRFPWRSVPAYVVAQVAGASLASLAVWGAYGDRAKAVAKLGMTSPTDGVSDFQALFVEILAGFLLVLVVTAVATDERVPAGTAAVAIGFALACCVLFAGPISGGAANPARALGPMIVNLQFPTSYATILGPIIGGVLGALLYDRVLRPATAPAIPVADATTDSADTATNERTAGA